MTNFLAEVICRSARASAGGFSYPLLNRGNGCRTIFRKDGNSTAFLKLLTEAGPRCEMRLLAYCLMPHHDGDLSDYMGWLQTGHVHRYHQHYHASSHVWQGRFRAFPIQEDDYLLTMLRYIDGATRNILFGCRRNGHCRLRTV